jgi:hypothetical protein
MGRPTLAQCSRRLTQGQAPPLSRAAKQQQPAVSWTRPSAVRRRTSHQVRGALLLLCSVQVLPGASSSTGGSTPCLNPCLLCQHICLRYCCIIY